MDMAYTVFFFVIFTSLVGTFFITKVIYELFLSVDYKGKQYINLNSNNEMQAEYLIRSALITSNDKIFVLCNGVSLETEIIVRKLKQDNIRLNIS